jgi:hypothetical protein
MSHVSLPAGEHVHLPIPTGHNAFLCSEAVRREPFWALVYEISGQLAPTPR